MQKHVFEFLGRRIELWTHPEPDHLAFAIGRARTFYEIDVLMKCRELYLPGSVIVDVGANIGNHSVFFGSILNAPVFAYEPHLPNYDLLIMNLAANGLDRQIVTACCVAIGEHNGVGSIRLGTPHNLGTAIVAVGAGDVEVKSLDSLDIPGPVGILKVDVEGAEPAVLRGAADLIRRWLPDIFVEAKHSSDFGAVADILPGSGYVPHGRYAWTPTYLFSAIHQTRRMREFLAANKGAECADP